MLADCLATGPPIPPGRVGDNLQNRTAKDLPVRHHHYHLLILDGLAYAQQEQAEASVFSEFISHPCANAP